MVVGKMKEEDASRGGNACRATKEGRGPRATTMMPTARIELVRMERSGDVLSLTIFYYDILLSRVSYSIQSIMLSDIFYIYAPECFASAVLVLWFLRALHIASNSTEAVRSAVLLSASRAVCNYTTTRARRRVLKLLTSVVHTTASRWYFIILAVRDIHEMTI
jgi:hypothetical protein